MPTPDKQNMKPSYDPFHRSRWTDSWLLPRPRKTEAVAHAIFTCIVFGAGGIQPVASNRQKPVVGASVGCSASMPSQ